MAVKTDVRLFRNTDFDYILTIYQDASYETVVNTSAWAMSWMVKTNPLDADADALITLTTADSILVSGVFSAVPSTNTEQVTIRVADTDTSSLVPGDYFWELKRTDATMETVLAYGTLSLVVSVHGN